jgi:two-component system CheB/CheR fusion protein
MVDASNVHTAASRVLQRSRLTAAVLLAAAIEAVDFFVQPGAGIPALYVVPLLLASYAIPRWTFHLAWLVSLLMVGRVLAVPFAGFSTAIIVNRVVALIVIWTAAPIVVRLTETSRTLETRTRDLADMKYAIDVSAILATTNTKGTITFANDKFCEISKYSREELTGQDHRLVNSGHHPKEFMRNLWGTIASGLIWRGEIRNRAKDGSIYWVDTTIVPFLDARGEPYQYMAIRYDITDRKRSEELLREQAALARLGQMAAVVAHEIKNPIAGIRGALQVISSRMPAEQRDRAVLSDIITRLDGLNGIVQDMLLFARPVQPKTTPVDVHSLIANTVEFLRRDPAHAGITVDLQGDSSIVAADAEQLRLVLQNIILNAAQSMGGEGAIDVQVSRSGAMCHIAIRDRGPGMPADVRDQAFEPFFTTKHRGTGLGLPIAKRVIELHGGEIDIALPDDGGTVVSIYLPLIAS